jgi:hypothetical protein
MTGGQGSELPVAKEMRQWFFVLLPIRDHPSRNLGPSFLGICGDGRCHVKGTVGLPTFGEVRWTFREFSNAMFFQFPRFSPIQRR